MMANKNFEKGKLYSRDELDGKRNMFYKKFIEDVQKEVI